MLAECDISDPEIIPPPTPRTASYILFLQLKNWSN